MAHAYRAVGWNRQKRLYDFAILAGIVVTCATFVGVGFAVRPESTPETLLLRALGACAFLLLHVVLCIGPLCRLDKRFLPLLYNRRHLGVATFCVGALHGLFTLVQYHALGDTDPITSLFTANRRFDSVAQFPFELLGVAALVILFLMAATSHDFWLRQLTAPVWKALHSLVYLAYGLLTMHVVLGVLQSETHPLWAWLLGAGVLTVLGLHAVAGWREAPGDREFASDVAAGDGWVLIGDPLSIPDGRARVVSVGGERVAVYRDGTRTYAISNVCQHQNGPLGEGCMREGLVVCPWHGYEYDPHNGSSPPPFTESVPVFRTEVRAGKLWLDPVPLAPGTPVEPGHCAESRP